MKGLSVTAIKYGETSLPPSMVFWDHDGSDDRKVPISLIVYLIESEGRRILVDAGCDTMPGYEVHHQISPAEALRRYGISPADITDVILTHAHHDHIEAVHHFENATVHIAAAELERAHSRGYLPAGRAVLPLTDTRIVAGVTATVWGGHSIGSLIVTFSHAGREYVIAGDECYDRACLAERRPTGVSYDPQRSRAFVERFSDPRYTVLLAHDAAILPGQNGTLKII